MSQLPVLGLALQLEPALLVLHLRLLAGDLRRRLPGRRPLLHQLRRGVVLRLRVELLEVRGQAAHRLLRVDVRGLGHEVPAMQAHRHVVEVVHVREVDVLGDAAIGL